VRRLLSIATITFAALAATSSADIVKLKNGETITGVVVSKDNHYITIEVACGEMGFDESLVESIDATQGPRTKEDVATLTDAARKRAADADAERAMAVARREAAIQAAEASATRREPVAAADTLAAEETRLARTEDDLQLRIDAADDVLQSVVNQRQRAQLKRLIYQYYLGPSSSSFDPTLGIAR
jgi:hypothetical protein